MEEENTRKDGESDVFASPNIRDAESEESSAREAQTSAVDGIPIAEEDIAFRAQDIKKHDDSKLFVKIEGAEKRARQAERDKKKHDDELIKRLHGAASQRKKEHRKARSEKRAAKRRAAVHAVKHKAKKVAKVIHRFRFALLAIAIVIVSVIIVNVAVIPAIKNFQATRQKAAEDKIVADNTTSMIKIFSDVVGEEIPKDELEIIIKDADTDIVAFYDETEGFVYHENGGSEIIKFKIIEDEKGIRVNKFNYINSRSDGNVSITKEGDVFYCLYGNDFQESNSLEELVRTYVLKMSGQAS